MIVPMTMRNSGIRDIEDVLGIHRDSGMAAIKTEADKIPQKLAAITISRVKTAELDEFWPFVGSTAYQRWHGMGGILRGSVSCRITTVVALTLLANSSIKSYSPNTTSNATILMIGNRTARCYRPKGIVSVKKTHSVSNGKTSTSGHISSA
jgi:hypothetical protein